MRRIEPRSRSSSKQCEFFVDTAADYKSDFVLFPELFTTQLLSLVNETRPGTGGAQAGRVHAAVPRADSAPGDQVQRQHHRRLAVRARGRRLLQRLLPVPARRHDREAVQDPRHAQRAALVGRRSRASRLQVFDTDRGKIAILICYDVEFPELARIAAGRGRADPLRALQHRRPLRLPARARLRPGARDREPGATWRSPAAPATCRSSRTPTSTTRSPASSRRSDVSFARDGDRRPSARRTSRPWSSTTSTSSCCAATATPARCGPGPTAARDLYAVHYGGPDDDEREA